ncbi:N-acetyltransferase 2 [Bombyx mori]|uniref:aralkylamine N-acetyltransferase n=1 Tax=Bombyx mori TaxID=7091 RepID=D7EZJ9_BOMMO|nr:N-acetyltransferase 2 [Bombyx mori]ACH57095.1 N-acetyltransferase 2 [Bombyx mori]
MADFVVVMPSMKDAVIQHLRDSFFADEPLNKAVGLCERGQPHAALERLCLATMTDGLSIAAMDGDKVLGVALNGILRHGDIEQSIEKIKQSTDEKFNKIFNILYTVSRDLNLFNTFEVDLIMECRIISVHENARGRGLAKELMKRSIDLARDNEFKLFKVDATGAFSQRICRSLSLEELKSVRYDEYCDESGTPIFRVPPPDHALCVMILKLP